MKMTSYQKACVKEARRILLTLGVNKCRVYSTGARVCKMVTLRIHGDSNARHTLKLDEVCAKIPGVTQCMRKWGGVKWFALAFPAYPPLTCRDDPVLLSLMRGKNVLPTVVFDRLEELGVDVAEMRADAEQRVCYWLRQQFKRNR